MASTNAADPDSLITPASLAQMADFRLGESTVSPSRRIVAGPGGEADVEPRVMQVLVALARSAGAVVTRNALFDSCWGGTYVGDDSLNRAIAGVRRLSTEVARGSFEIETIPRTGYRLSGEVSGLDSASPADATVGSSGVSRRVAIGSAAAAAALALGGTFWIGARERSRAAGLVANGQRTLREAWPGAAQKAVADLREAAALEPSNSEAWGLLAVALRNAAEQAPPSRTTAIVLECEEAAKRALAIDSRNANAMTALATVRPEFGNWAETEEALRHALEAEPDNPAALNYLVLLLQSVGRARESWDFNEHVARVEPLSPVHQYRRGLKLWIFGRVPEADLTIDRALQMWPRHPAVWNARVYIFAFTGRADAAVQMIDDKRLRPATLTPAAASYWRSSLRALATGSVADRDEARRINVRLAPTSPGFAVASMMVLSALGEVDTAFAVAEGTLLRRGPLIGTIWSGNGEMPVNDQYWRRTMNLFTPATAAMRADARFHALCDGMGMTAYWRQRGVAPDRFFNLA